ncbi:ricin-type beta-trefoil lectin domain protein [Streptomyces sp. NPDC053079]|uniref:ricin-type beta-trefoil lectin domain protein n=1 Tax=Streptomyces sp. NPDC053079 TaxID=3365697 RepID=UPI0037D2A046
MRKIQKTAVALSTAALLGGGILASGAPAAAAPTADVWYQFQNMATDRNFDSYRSDVLYAYSPDGSNSQEFRLQSGNLPGYQIVDRRHGKCVTAKGLNKNIALERCNTNLQSQYWDFNVNDQGSAFQSRKYSHGCIQDSGQNQPMVLKTCSRGPIQQYLPLAEGGKKARH